MGQIELARFVNRKSLNAWWKSLSRYRRPGACDHQPSAARRTQGDRAGQLEMSNVDRCAKLISLITTQRSFEMNSQAIRCG
ncbi:MAG: hypothetical protein H6817_05230 [Phycisphaerales bacterium]|nr:hypothetical protein [Phycisphaerales bacterium]